MSNPLDRPFVIPEEPKFREAGEQPQAAVIIETEDARPIAPETHSAPPLRSRAVQTMPGPSTTRRTPWIALSVVGIFGLLIVAAVDWLLALYASNPALGLAGSLFLVLSLGGALAWSTRELRAIARLKDVAAIQALLDWTAVPPDRLATRRRIDSAIGLISHLAGYGPGIAAWRDAPAVDAPPAQMLRMFETKVLEAADSTALRAVRRASRDAFGLVALSPTAITDTALFTGRAIRMMREVAEAYGHRPTNGSVVILARRVLADAAIVSMADFVGDVVANFFGGTLVDKVSVVAAEGSIAAQRMAKLGLLTIECCRPIRFHPDRRQGLGAIING